MKKTASSETISFRIDCHAADEARRNVAESGAASIHSYARDLFLSALAEHAIQAENNQLHEDLREVSQEVLELRHDLHLLFTRSVAMLADLSVEEVEEVLFSDLPLEGESDE